MMQRPMQHSHSDAPCRHSAHLSMARTREIALTFPLSSEEGAHKLIGLAASRRLVAIAEWWFLSATTDGATYTKCKSGGGGK